MQNQKDFRVLETLTNDDSLDFWNSNIACCHPYFCSINNHVFCGATESTLSCFTWFTSWHSLRHKKFLCWMYWTYTPRTLAHDPRYNMP